MPIPPQTPARTRQLLQLLQLLHEHAPQAARKQVGVVDKGAPKLAVSRHPLRHLGLLHHQLQAVRRADGEVQQV